MALRRGATLGAVKLALHRVCAPALFALLAHVLPAVQGAPFSILAEEGGEAPDEPPGSASFWIKGAVSVGLVLLGGIFAGLTIGLMGLEPVNLHVLATSGEPDEQVDAAKVLKLLERGKHWVLVVLLLSNVVVNESLPIFLDSILGGGVAAVVSSTTLIVIFGEIIPQAICNRYGLKIGAKCTYFVLALMYIEFPIAYPTAKLLDWLLGDDEGVAYRKAELKTFVNLHLERHLINEDEATIIGAVLDLSQRKVGDIMTPIDRTYTLPMDKVLDQAAVDEILALGHSRIPIRSETRSDVFLGMLIVKKLISYDPHEEKLVKDFPLSVLPETAPDSTCLDALNYFQQGRSHILLVSDTPGEDGGAVGIVSLEDVIEEMIGEEIVDETDQWLDVARRVKVVRGPSGRKQQQQAIGPLIKGIIERRRTYRENDPIKTQARAFSRVKVKGGGEPERRPMFASKLTAEPSENGENGDGSPSANSEQAPSERSPLLKRQTK